MSEGTNKIPDIERMSVLLGISTEELKQRADKIIAHWGHGAVVCTWDAEKQQLIKTCPQCGILDEID